MYKYNWYKYSCIKQWVALIYFVAMDTCSWTLVLLKQLCQNEHMYSSQSVQWRQRLFLRLYNGWMLSNTRGKKQLCENEDSLNIIIHYEFISICAVTSVFISVGTVSSQLNFCVITASITCITGQCVYHRNFKMIVSNVHPCDQLKSHPLWHRCTE